MLDKGKIQSALGSVDFVDYPVIGFPVHAFGLAVFIVQLAFKPVYQAVHTAHNV
jgi:hypothetical protein